VRFQRGSMIGHESFLLKPLTAFRVQAPSDSASG
jgi:hypothetical protein